MNKFFKIGVFLVFVALIIFVIFMNIEKVEDAKKKEPTIQELEEFNFVNQKTEANSYEVKDISERQMALIYYNDLKNQVINYQDEAYSKLKNKDVITKAVFESFRTNLINNYYTDKIASYDVFTTGGQKIYKIENNSNQEIIFYIDSVMNYTFELNL